MTQNIMKKIEEIKEYGYKHDSKKVMELFNSLNVNDIPPEGKYELLMLVADVLYYDDNCDRAIKCYKRIIELDLPGTDRAKCYHHIGFCYLDKENYEEAIRYLKSALKYTNDRNQFDHIYTSLGLAYKDGGYYREAIEIYEKQIELLSPTMNQNEKEDIEYAYHSIAICYWKLEQEEKADEYFNKLINMPNPSKKNLGRAHGILGHRFYEKEKWDEALKNYKIAKKYAKSKEDKVHWQKYIDYCKEQMKKLN